MSDQQHRLKETYDAKYATPNFFQDRLWLYRPFVRALVAKARLKPGASLLDAGCGQGFFTNLFAEQGLQTQGVDLSEVGIAVAKGVYAASGAVFSVGDILALDMPDSFDCVFTRSCSLYNSPLLEGGSRATDALYSYLKNGGVLIFDYYARLKTGIESPDWIYHSVAHVQNHFAKFRDAEVFFSLRLETVLLGRFSFCRASSIFCERVSRLTGMGGELLAFVRKKDKG